jgi:hypothetical protein
MRQSDRRKILWFLVFLFVVAGGGATFYAQGYRLDLSPFAVQKIGAIYVKSFPGNSSVYLDGKQVEKTRHIFGTSFFFLQGGTLINNLFPKKYMLTLKSDGYGDWQQTMEVRPSLVTEAKYAVLAPKTPTAVSTTSISGFWLPGNNIVSQTPAGVLKSGTKILPGSKVLGQSRDGKMLISDKNGDVFEYNLNNGSSVNVTVLLTANGLAAGRFSKIYMDQGNDILLLGERSVYALNLDSGTLTNATKASSSSLVMVAAASSPDIIAASGYNAVRDTSVIFLYDKSSRTAFTYSAPLPGRTIQMVFKNNRLGIIESDGSFFYGDPRSANGLVQVASDARSVSFADNLDLAAVKEGNALEIIPLSGNKEDYARFTPPNIGQIQNILWYSDGHHLFLSYTDKTLFLDTGDTHLEHLYEVGSAGAKYMPETNELYFPQNGFLNKLTFPS